MAADDRRLGLLRPSPRRGRGNSVAKSPDDGEHWVVDEPRSALKADYFLAGQWQTPRASVQKHMTSLDDLLQLALGHPRQRDAVMVPEIDHRIPMCVGCDSDCSSWTVWALVKWSSSSVSCWGLKLVTVSAPIPGANRK